MTFITLFSIPFTTLFFSLNHCIAFAQYIPTTLYGPQSAFVDGKALYVHGGRTLELIDSNPPSGQTFMLDLSTSWTIDKPAFRQLASGFPSEGATSTLFNNNTSWYLSVHQNITIYDIITNTWGQTRFYNNSNSGFNMRAVTDPTNNVVYVVNGWKSNNVVKTMQYQQSTGDILPTGASVSVAGGYAAVWSTKRNSLLLHGGLNDDRTVIQKILYEYVPDRKTFVPLADSGEMPPPTYGHCMVEAYGGNKIIIFGGVTDQVPTSGDVYILDVATLTWSKGGTTGMDPNMLKRSYAACAVTNDMFVAWGGATQFNNTFTAVTMSTVVYNLKTNIWQNSFSPAKSVDRDDPASSNSGAPISAIVGGVVGGLVLITAIVVFVVYSHKKRRNGKHKLSKEGRRGLGSEGSDSDDSIAFTQGGDANTRRATYVVHAPVESDFIPMAPTGYESTAYTAVPYQQPNNQAQLGGGIAIFAEPTYHTGYVPSKLASQQQQPTEQIYKLSNVSVGQENPVLYQPLLVTQPPQSSSQPQYQQQCHLSADQDPTAGYAIPGISPRTTVSAVPSSVNWANSPTVTTTSTTEASVGHEWSAFSKDELTRRNPQELSS